MLDDGRASSNQRPAHDERAEDAPEQHTMLKLQGHAKISEDERDDEDVVHRERQLDDVAGDELDGVLPPPAADKRGSDEQSEHKRQRDPKRRPSDGFLEFDDMRALVEDAKVEREKDQNAREKPDVMPS